MRLLFALTLFVSATLLFVVQPMFAKMVLPLLGGTPAVWNTCMVFYQAVLLIGYLYAHLSIRWLGAKRQSVLHMGLFCLPWLVLPIGVAAIGVPPVESNPIPWLLLLLAASVGLPFLFVSASAPMLQAWFAATGHPSARDPYFLYSASNLGSILALLGYPLLLEPYLTLDGQTWSWAAGYGILMVLSLLCAVCLWRSRGAEMAVPVGHESADSATDSPGGVPTWAGRARWLALSFAPSSLLLGVTTYMSTDLASMPLLWVIPLTLYLLTFVLVFARWKLLPHRLMVMIQPVLVVIVAAAYFCGGTSTSYLTIMFPLHLLAFFVTAMVCHGELAADRPVTRYLTEFYLWMSLGGVLGGVFNAMVAPQLFDDVYEYPLMIAVACLLRPAVADSRRQTLAGWLDFALPVGMAVSLGFAAAGLNRSDVLAHWIDRLWSGVQAWGWSSIEIDSSKVATVLFLGLAALIAWLCQRRPVRFGLSVFALLVVSLVYSGGRLRPLYAQRSFFGVLRVRHTTKWKEGCLLYEAHQLLHGSTNHGVQCLDPVARLEPWTYYHRKGPVGRVFRALEEKGPVEKIGVIGLGTGTIAAYGKPGRHITFYEIDPAVLYIARDSGLFTYLADSRSTIDYVLGDARQSLAHEDPPRRFDLLLVDAFSSDAIPIHLLTKEALALYFEHLTEHGVLAVHISNRHLDLEPVLGNLVEDAGRAARVCSDNSERDMGKFASTWVAIARCEEDLGHLAKADCWRTLHTNPKQGLWTDNFSNVVGVLDLDLDLSGLVPWTREEED